MIEMYNADSIKVLEGSRGCSQKTCDVYWFYQ